MTRRRVVITGLGAVSPIGNTAKDSWNAVKNGKSGVGKITLFDATGFAVQIAAEVKDFSLDSYGVDRKMLRKISRFTSFLLGASIEAFTDAGFSNEALRASNAGIVTGVGIGISDVVETAYKKYFDPNAGVNRLPPLSAALMLSNEAAANVSMHYRLHGPAWTLSTACASGTDALGLSLNMIRGGQLDVCLASGTDANITGYNIGCFQMIQALTSSFNDEPEKASRPFDRDRSGFVMGEGAAALVLEELEHAKRRGAHIYAEVKGFGSTSDAYHITAPLPDASGGILAMQNAFRDAEMQPSDIQYYNAHGTSTPANDKCETLMIKQVFGDAAKSLKISSTKSETGHMVGAAGTIEALFCIKAIEEGFAPPTINLDNPDIENGCDLDYVANCGVRLNIDAAASCSLGFGGHNSCIIIKKYTD